MRPIKYGRQAHVPIPKYDEPILDPKEKTKVQQIVGSVLFYDQALDQTNLVALSEIASNQLKPTNTTQQKNFWSTSLSTSPQIHQRQLDTSHRT